MDERQQLLKTLRGQTIAIEGLQDAFKSWPAATHPQIDVLREDVDLRLKRLFPRHPKLHRLLEGDYGMFGATWWPSASLRTARVATFLAIWLFMWDDEIDSDVGSLAHDFDSAQSFRAATLDYVRASLKLELPEGYERGKTTPNAVIESFDDMAIEMLDLYSQDQRGLFLTELGFFLEKSEVEQRLRLLNRVPTFREFWSYRLGTSAVRVVLAVNELCNGTNLPSEVMKDNDMVSVWDLTNAIICMTNDLLSVKKELTDGSIESLLPILYSELGSTQAAADHIMGTLRQQIAEFDETASKLYCRYRDTPEVRSPLRAFIDGCQYYCTGNLSWSLSTGRYQVDADVCDDTLILKL